MAATILAFPARGGNGFTIASCPKPKKVDQTNLVQMARKADGPAVSKLTRTPELLLAMLLFQQLSRGRKDAILFHLDQIATATGDQQVSQLSATLEHLLKRRR